MTCTGKTVAENIKGHEIKDTNIIKTIDNPYSTTRWNSSIKRKLAPEG